MTDRGKKFEFEPRTEGKTEIPEPGLSQRVTNALADQAFIRAPSPVKAPAKPTSEKPQTITKPLSILEKKRSMEKRDLETRSTAPVPIPSKSAMVSTGTMTTPSLPPTAAKAVADRGIWKVSTHEGVVRPASSDKTVSKPLPPEPAEKKSRLARLLQEDSSKSQGVLEQESQSPTSSRPSLEGGRPSAREFDMGLTRSRSLNIQQRPVSVNMGKGPTHIKDREIRQSDYEANFVSAEPDGVDSAAIESDMNIHSDIDFLKAREEEEKERKGHHKRLSSGSRHGKRASLPHISLSGTKNILTGRFGDAFKMFEGGHHHSHSHGHDHEKSPQLPPQDRRDVLTPIAGSEATDLSDDRQALDETEDLSPEMRRELEKRHLEAEERRVEQAAAEYRQRVAARGGGAGALPGVNRAATIQSKVHSLLSENNRPAQKTATGYGRFTQEGTLPHTSNMERPAVPASITRVPVNPTLKSSATVDVKPLSALASAMKLPAQDARSQRPTAPPKPKVLRTGQGNLSSPAVNPPAAGNEPISPEDWEAKFNKRFPSLSGIEMVETDIDQKSPSTRIREV